MLLATISAIALVAGCGGGSPPTAPSTPTPTPVPTPVKSLVTQGTSSDLQANYVHWVVFTTNKTGRIDISVDWTNSSDSVRLLVATGRHTCYDGTYANFDICNIITSLNDDSKPKMTSLPGEPAGTYTLYIDNLGPETESVAWQIFLTAPG